MARGGRVQMGAQEVSKPVNHAAKTAQDRPRVAQDGPRCPQDASTIGPIGLQGDRQEGPRRQEFLTLRAPPPAHPKTVPRRIAVVREVRGHTE
eukprot:2493109-Pyramimonas_sp.AAC.1